MKKSDIKTIVVEELKKVMAAIGANAPPFVDSMCPIGALPNFDSVLAEDTTVDIFIKLALEADDDVNPFLNGNHKCTLAEVVDTLHRLLEKAK